MSKALTKIDAGDLVVIVGWAAEAFAGNLASELCADQGLKALILRASEKPLPRLLQTAHETMAAVIVIDPGTPEQRTRELVALADLVLRSVGPHSARVLRERVRPTITLRATA